ncbi:MAG: trypsin-like peptidase domain-containing protein [Phycisphaeraceae bacterium]|nr:trypsin-like peptidase domain-containing protein [Phycisphaeraceae bacterium]
MIRTLGGAAVIAAALATQSRGVEPARSPDSAIDFRETVQKGKSKVFPAVVYIRVVREDNDRGEKKAQQISGSGVIISSDGEVLTNWHVIDKAQDVRCLLTDGRALPATVIGSDKDTDLALIRLRQKPGDAALPFAQFGDSSKLHEGDFVMAMGAPWGLNRSVSIGIVSCVRRYLEGISEYSLWLQTDAAINPGNSGGPLVNTDGEVVGINARGTSGSAEGLGFAIPSDTVSVLIAQIRQFSKVNWTWFGLQLQPLRDFNKDTYFEGATGVMVAETDLDSPARSAGIRPRDRLLSVNGAELSGLTEEDLPAVRRKLGLLPKNTPATFVVQRGSEKLTVEITPREKGAVEGKELALKRWDMTIKEINQFDNPELYFHRNQGVFVHATKYPGNASGSGLSGNDIILKIDGKEVATLADVESLHAELVANVESKSRIVLTVLRGGLTRQVVLDFHRDFDRE